MIYCYWISSILNYTLSLFPDTLKNSSKDRTLVGQYCEYAAAFPKLLRITSA